MKLTFQERANLGGILPKEGDWITLTSIRDLQKTIMPTENDLKEIDGVVDGIGNITYNVSKDKEKEYELSTIALKIIKEVLLKMDKEKKLTLSLISLYEKFAS
jgi:hypothetical protein